MYENPNIVREIRNTIYQLKHQMGTPAWVYQITSAETDYRSGQRQRTVTKKFVRHAIALPANGGRKGYQGINVLTDAKIFASQGGQGWDQDARSFVFDGRDLPGHVWAPEDWIVCQGQRYEVVTIEVLDFGAGWAIDCKRLHGLGAQQVIEQELTAEFPVSGEVNIEP